MTKEEKTISNRIIRKLNPCYDPSEVVKDENEELPVKEWVTYLKQNTICDFAERELGLVKKEFKLI